MPAPWGDPAPSPWAIGSKVGGIGCAETPPFSTAGSISNARRNRSHLRYVDKWCRTVRVSDDNSTGVVPAERSAISEPVSEKKSAENFENLGSEDLKDRRGRIERWEAERSGAEEVIFQRVAEGETLKAICRSRRWPYSIVARWVGETPSVFKAYEFALRLWADSLATETPGIADDADPTEVGHAKLRVDARMKLASRLDRARYGDKVEVSGEVRHTHSLIGILSGLGSPAIEHDVTPALPTVAAPAYEEV